MCGCQSGIVICDDTMLAFRKDLPISDDADVTNEVPEHMLKGNSHGKHNATSCSDRFESFETRRIHVKLPYSAGLHVVHLKLLKH